MKQQNSNEISPCQREFYKSTVCEHYESVYRFMLYLTGNKSLAEDLTQETFSSGWSSISNYRRKSSMRTWLHKIAYHKFIDSTRKSKRHNDLISELKNDGLNMHGIVDPLLEVMADENSKLLYEGIRTLKPKEYTVIILHYIQDLSFRQMAKVLGKSTGMVKWQTSYALKKLRKFLIDRI